MVNHHRPGGQCHRKHTHFLDLNGTIIKGTSFNRNQIEDEEEKEKEDEEEKEKEDEEEGNVPGDHQRPAANANEALRTGKPALSFSPRPLW
jgi:hypothetical protein